MKCEIVLNQNKSTKYEKYLEKNKTIIIEMKIGFFILKK